MRRRAGRSPAKDTVLRRGTDRFEDAVAWVLMSIGLVLLVVAVMIGVGTRAGAIERAAAVRATHTEVAATVLADVPVLAAEGATSTKRWATARWVERDGTTREDVVLVPGGVRAGTQVTVWVDRNGRIGPSPTSDAEALIVAVLGAFFTLLFGGILLGGAWAVVRRVTIAHNVRRWEEEWARVGPEWTRHLR
jgi:hypothetical protein